MSKHDQIQCQLYDYIQGGLELHERKKIEAHAASCAVCNRELEELRDLIENPLPTLGEPSDERTPAYWNDFASEVERRIQEIDGQRLVRQFSLWDWLNSLLVFNKSQVITIGSVLAVVCAAISLWLLHTPLPVEEKIVSPPIVSAQFAEVDQKVSNYLHKSKTLLVGISNLDLARDNSIDLTTEKKVSRQLVREARYLHDQPLDIRSARLIGDLEKIQIEIGTMKDYGAVPHIEMVRNGIYRENLLFKIRMAESMYDTRGVISANKISTGDRK